MLLYGKPVVDHLFEETAQRVVDHASAESYIAFFLFSEDVPSAIYVNKKQAYATRLGLHSRVVHEPAASYDDVIKHIGIYNADPDCLGIVVQLPLAEHLKSRQADILTAVLAKKDLDGLGGHMFGLHLTQVVNFLPATPKAVFELLDWYDIGDLSGKTVLMIGQSNLIGKPFVLEAMHRGATVISTNSKTSQDLFRDACKKSEYIVSATGSYHLLTPDLFDHQDITGKIIVDVGYGIKNGKAHGDTDREGLAACGAWITPVPGGIGPITVASLFHNLCSMHT